MMPEMTGTELAASIRRLHPDLPIMFVTGYVGDAGEAEDLAGGEVLRKPFTISALADSVAAALAARPVSGSHRPATDGATA